MISNRATRLLGEKKDRTATQARAKALPGDNQVVHEQMQAHLWRFTAGDGMDIIAGHQTRQTSPC